MSPLDYAPMISAEQYNQLYALFHEIAIENGLSTTIHQSASYLSFAFSRDVIEVDVEEDVIAIEGDNYTTMIDHDN